MNIPIRRGMIIRHQGRIFIVEEYHERHAGKQKPTVHVQIRDLLDGRHVSRTIDELQPLQEVQYSYRELQYLYHRPNKGGGDQYIFMDNESLEEYELSDQHLGGFQPFLSEGQSFRMMFVDGRPARLDLPELISLHVSLTAAPERSVGASGNVLKEATLENGLVVRVPLFIKTGDLIRIDTRTRTYAGKEKEQHA
jgi:elongation factor P